jgi:hypothetical protein
MEKKTRIREVKECIQQADAEVLKSAGDFVQSWIAHPRDVQLIGRNHAELIRVVLNRRAVRGEL